MVNPVPYRVRQLPLVGPWASRIGRTVDIWGMSCNTPVDIWVEAAWKTIPRMLIMLIKPSAIEAGRSRFGKKHHVKPKWALSSNVVVNGLGTPIPGAFTSMLFRYSGFGAAALQYIQFADIATRGLVHWSSLVYTFSGCSVPGGGGGVLVNSTPSVQLGSLSGSFLTLNTNSIISPGAVGAAFNWACDSSQQWAGSFSIDWQDIPGLPPSGAEFELVNAAGLNQQNGANRGFNNDGSNWSGGFWRPGTFPENTGGFKVKYRAAHAFQINSASFSVTGAPIRDLLKPDP